MQFILVMIPECRDGGPGNNGIGTEGKLTQGDGACADPIRSCVRDASESSS